VIALLISMALHAADTPQLPSAPQPSFTGAVPLQADAPLAVQAPPPPRPAPVRTVTAPAPKVTPRVDQKRPYMRVWYWPPMPVDPSGPSPFSTGQGGTGNDAVDPRGNKLDDVNFPTNRAKVVDELSQLEHLAGWMKGNPKVEVILDGYADPRGSQAHNQKLAAHRAQSVKDFLVARGVPASHITTAGHGASNPVKGETQDEGYWLSRRVVIRFRNAPDAAPAPHVHSPKPEKEN